MKRNKLNNKVAIIMGSKSDHSVMRECEKILKILKIKFQLSIVSAHRTPKRMFEFAESASKKGFGVIVAGAGGSAHLPGMVASLSTLPVIGVPIESKKLKGIMKVKQLKKNKLKTNINKNLKKISLFELQNSPKFLNFRVRA